MITGNFKTESPIATFDLGHELGAELRGGEIILLDGGLGAGKTLFTKGIMSALDYDIDEVTSPSFTLVNHYAANLNVFHLDLWRIDSDAAFAVGLEELLDDPLAVIIIEWPERLGSFSFNRRVFRVEIKGDGDDIREIRITDVEDA